MTEGSEEMRMRAEAIALRTQATRHQDVIVELRTRDEEQRRRIEQLLTIISEIYAAQTAETARRVEEVRVTQAQERAKKEQEQAEKKQQNEERVAREEALRPYMNLADVRTAFWVILHRPPFTTVHESFLDGFPSEASLHVSTRARSWISGEFTTSFPPGDGLANITVLVDWKPEDDPSNPQLLWKIQAPHSLFNPGDHYGRFDLKVPIHIDISSRVLGAVKIQASFINMDVTWMSPIFSPYPSSDGRLSSLGPLEENSAHRILLPTLHSIAHILVHGPFAPPREPIFGWHDMDRSAAQFFSEKSTAQNGVEERCMRATAFFANAFNQSNRSDLAALDSVMLPMESREISIMAIRELLDFFQISAQVAAKAENDLTWDFEESYDTIATHREWMTLDGQWATRIAELAKLRFLTKAAKEQTRITEVRFLSRGILSNTLRLIC